MSMRLGEGLRSSIQRIVFSGLAKVIEGTAFCGYAGKDKRGNPIEVHDHTVLGVRGDKQNLVANPVGGVETVPYNSAVHGEITEWRKEGEIAPGTGAPHSHGGESGQIGAYELGR